MRSAFVAALFATGAFAVPYQKRAVVTDYDVVYVTKVVTVTAGAKPTTVAGYSSHSTASVAPVTTSVHIVSTKASSTAKSSAKSSSKASSKSTAKSSAASTAQASKPTTYQEIAVYHHNLHRANHSAPSVTWSNDLASTAATIAASCNYAHNVQVNGGGYGQNIAAGVEANNISSIITDLFYNGEVGWFADLYGEAQPSMTNFEHWGHFSQIVWKGTTAVGCATQDCSKQGLTGVGSNVPPYFTVCNYKSPGNYANEYAANIGSPLNRPTAHWNTGL